MGNYHILLELDIDADPRPRQAGDRHRGRDQCLVDERTRSTRCRRRAVAVVPGGPQPFEFDVRDVTDRARVGDRRLPAAMGGDDHPTRRRSAPGGARARACMFGHRDWEPDNPVIPNVAMTWARILLRLKGYAETGDAPAVLRLLTTDGHRHHRQHRHRRAARSRRRAFSSTPAATPSGSAASTGSSW